MGRPVNLTVEAIRQRDAETEAALLALVNEILDAKGEVCSTDIVVAWSEGRAPHWHDRRTGFRIVQKQLPTWAAKLGLVVSDRRSPISGMKRHYYRRPER